MPFQLSWAAKVCPRWRHDRLLVSTSQAELLLIDARASEYKLLGRQKVIDGEDGLLSHPALVGRRLYLRARRA